MESKIANEEYLLGELVEPKTFQKSTVSHDGSIIKTTYTVHARRIPHNMIREKIYQEHKSLGTKYFELKIHTLHFLYIFVLNLFIFFIKQTQ